MEFFRRLAPTVFALLFGAAGANAENSRSVIAMTLTESEHGGGRVYLPVRFGAVMGTMRLDTGASTSRIALAPWNKDLPDVGESVSAGATGQAARCADVEARNVALKASQGNDVARAKYVVTRCEANAGDDLLGLDFFKNARFTLDFGRRELVFFGEPFAQSRAKPFRLLGPDRRLAGVDLRLGNAAAVGLFDSGAELCAVDRQFALKHRKLFTLVKSKGKAVEAGGKSFATRIYKIKALDLGEGRIVRDVYALAYDFGPLREFLGEGTPVILGYNLLSRFTWDLDFRAPDAPTWDARARQGHSGSPRARVGSRAGL